MGLRNPRKKERKWDRHAACTNPVPLGQEKVKRDLSLSHGQVIYPRWPPAPVARQALYPRRNLSQSNLSQPVPQSGTTRPWKFSFETLRDLTCKLLRSHAFCEQDQCVGEAPPLPVPLHVKCTLCRRSRPSIKGLKRVLGIVLTKKMRGQSLNQKTGKSRNRFAVSGVGVGA